MDTQIGGILFDSDGTRRDVCNNYIHMMVRVSIQNRGDKTLKIAMTHKMIDITDSIDISDFACYFLGVDSIEDLMINRRGRIVPKPFRKA